MQRSCILLHSDELESFQVGPYCLVRLSLRTIAISKRMIGQEGSFRVGCEAFEVDLCPMVVLEGQIQFSPETDSLLEAWVLSDAFIDHLQTLIYLTYIPLSVPSLFRAIADRRIALGLLWYSSEMATR